MRDTHLESCSIGVAISTSKFVGKNQGKDENQRCTLLNFIS